MITRPVLIRNHLHPADEKPLLILHEDGVYLPKPALVALIGTFIDDGKGGLIAAGKCEDGRFGYLNGRGQWVVPPTLQDAKNFSSDRLARFCDCGLWGYRGVDGSVTIAPQFEMAHAFNQGRAAVKTGKRWHYIDHLGNPAFNGDFRVAEAFSECGLALACAELSKGFGFIDRDGNWAIKPQFSHSPGFSRQGVAPVSLNGEDYGLIDRNGAWIHKPGKLHIKKFNDEGYAYYYETRAGLDREGYLDTSGSPAIAGESRLSKQMHAGLALSSAIGFVGPAGRLETSDHISWTTDFNEHGFTVARAWGVGNRAARWGILHIDGSFNAAPDGVLEPLTDTEGWIVPPEPDTPLAPFCTQDKAVALLDQTGATAYRLEAAPSVAGHSITLRDADGCMLWQSEGCAHISPAALFFEMPGEPFLEGLDGCGDIAGTVETMLAEAERNLHGLARGEQENEAAGDGEADHVDDDEEAVEEEHDDEELDHVAFAAELCTRSRRVWRVYLDEHIWGEYEFLGDQRGGLRDQIHQSLIAELTRAYGKPDPDPDYANRDIHRSTLAWAFPLRSALPGANDARAYDSRLWVGISAFSDCGDGDVWHEIWLHCAPSIETLEAAIAAALLTGDDSLEDDSDEEAASGAQADAPGYDAWMARVRESDDEVGKVPPEMLDDAMADAAIEANTTAFSYLPPALQTAARLERIVRKSAEDAAHISAPCMTANALALARSLYANDATWYRKDERRSRIPKRRINRNSLSEVWGCLVDDKLAHAAVTAGVSLGDIPRWLRSDQLDHAALQADVNNIAFLAPHKVTPELALAAVREKYSGLIEALPLELRTAQVCLESVSVDGSTLEFVPDELKTAALCASALRQSAEAFEFVLPEVDEQVCALLIMEDLAARDGAEKGGTRWHGVRAWSRLWRKEYEGAIADATLALAHVPFPAHQHYILARAYMALGQSLKAAAHAAAVLSIENSYETEYARYHETAWLKRVAASAMRAADDATLLTEVKANPLALSQIPQSRVTAAMVAAAVAANQETVRYVPKRLMNSALYALAVELGVKSKEQVPAAFKRAP